MVLFQSGGIGLSEETTRAGAARHAEQVEGVRVRGVFSREEWKCWMIPRGYDKLWVIQQEWKESLDGHARL